MDLLYRASQSLQPNKAATAEPLDVMPSCAMSREPSQGLDRHVEASGDRFQEVS